MAALWAWAAVVSGASAERGGRPADARSALVSVMTSCAVRSRPEGLNGRAQSAVQYRSPERGSGTHATPAWS